MRRASLRDVDSRVKPGNDDFWFSRRDPEMQAKYRRRPADKRSAPITNPRAPSQRCERALAKGKVWLSRRKVGCVIEPGSVVVRHRTSFGRPTPGETVQAGGSLAGKLSSSVPSTQSAKAGRCSSR